MTSPKIGIVAGKLYKKNGTVHVSAVTEQSFSGIRWGMAAADCRSARHTHSPMCATLAS